MIKPDDFHSWLEHPITKKYIQYLKDLRDAHQNELIDITNRPIDYPPTLVGNLGGKVYIFDALSQLTAHTINEFYGETTEGED